MESLELYTVGWLHQNYAGHLECLYKHMYKRLFLFVRNFLMDEELADDLIQELFMNLWLKGKDMKEDILLERYLYTSAKNLCIDYYRKLNIIDKYQKHLLETEAMVCNVVEEEDAELAEKVRKVLSELPEMQRRVLELSVIEGLKYREVAERLNIAEGTVHTHVKRAYKYFKEHFGVGVWFWFILSGS